MAVYLGRLKYKDKLCLISNNLQELKDISDKIKDSKLFVIEKINDLHLSILDSEEEKTRRLNWEQS